jgi:hypothetical protein
LNKLVLLILVDEVKIYRSNMGKSKANKGGSKATAPPAKKCTCTHLYQCDCGNRPERPSRGHRWDPETQQWGGKGHKQKGGSGQTSVVGQEAKVTDKGKTQLAQWQTLPSEILREYCHKQKRPPPKFKELLDDKRSKPNKFKCRVIVPDPKTNRDKDLIFIPAKPVPNEEQAKEEAALLALLHLTPKLPHERKLPDPYKTTWLAAVESIKNATTKAKGQNSSNSNNNYKDDGGKDDGKNAGGGGDGGRKSGATSNTSLSLGSAYTSRSEKSRNADVKRQARNARIRKHEAVRMANRDHPVFLSARLRNQIQQILRGDFAGLLSDESNDENDPELSTYDSDVQEYVEDRLYSEGFTKRQARTAFNEQAKSKAKTVEEDQWDQVYDDCLQWLCVHLDEDQLPEGFDPRGGTLELDTSTVVKGSTEASKVASRFGISMRDANWLLQQQKDENHGNASLEILFWRQICKIADVKVSEENCESHGDDSENREAAGEEFEALQAMFDSDCSSAPGKDGKSSTLVIKTPERLDIHLSYVPGKYPSVFPKYVLFLGKWERPVGVAFHVEIAKFMSTLPLGDPVFFEIYGEEQNMLQTLEDLPLLHLSSTSVPKPIGKGSSSSSTAPSSSASTSTKTASKKTSSGISMKRRPKARSVFWSTPPKQTPPAISFNWSKSIERQRKSLPAWKARADFLSKLEESCKSSRVVLVTGDTGCGKTTQIPQFILEENPTTAKIVIAQPRRLAVSSCSYSIIPP